MASLTFNHGSYFAVFSIGQKKKWKKIGKVNKREAKRILKQLEIDYERNRLNLLEMKQITLYEFIELYMDYTKTNKALSSYQRERKIVLLINFTPSSYILWLFTVCYCC